MNQKNKNICYRCLQETEYVDNKCKVCEAVLA